MASITTTNHAPRVWAACLACYNAGRPVSQWVDCTDAEGVSLAQLHRGSGGPYAGCEEIWCLDHENIPARGEIGLLEASDWGRVYTEVGEEHWPALCAWVDSGAYVADGTGDIPLVSGFEEHYQGLWSSFREYAEQLAEDTGLTDGWPDEAQRYFNWGAWTHDLIHDYTVVNASAPKYGVFVFRDL